MWVISWCFNFVCNLNIFGLKLTSSFCCCCYCFELSTCSWWVNVSFLFVIRIYLVWYLLDLLLLLLLSIVDIQGPVSEFFTLFVIWIYFGLIVRWSVIVVIVLNCRHIESELMFYFCLYFEYTLVWYLLVVALNCRHIESVLMRYFCL